MGKIKVRQIDAFTRVPHTGNPAGVVLEGRDLSEMQMQSIAREMNLSETVFVLPPTRAEADIRIRWFTPTMEVSLCGHATVACFHSLAEEGGLGMEKPGKYSFGVETASGILPVEVTKEGGEITVMMGMRLPVLERAQGYKIDLPRILNIATSDFENRLPIVRGESLFVPVRRLHTLFTMRPNFLAMASFLSSRKLGGICMYTTETIDRESLVHSRFFAPTLGVNEDPVTGTTHAPLAVLLFENGFLHVVKGCGNFQGEQGDAIGRKGRVKVELNVENDQPVSVRVGGNAVTVLEGEMIIYD
jgi:trans-2,3-dihydro-3-hydroxyanthranilate isomerase